MKMKIVNDFFYCSVYEMAKSVSYEHRNRLASPIDTAVWWIEHVIATGGYEFGKANTHEMYWFYYYSIDSIILTFIVILSLILIVVKLLKLFCQSRSIDIKTKTKEQ